MVTNRVNGHAPDLRHQLRQDVIEAGRAVHDKLTKDLASLEAQTREDVLLVVKKLHAKHTQQLEGQAQKFEASLNTLSGEVKALHKQLDERTTSQPTTLAGPTADWERQQLDRLMKLKSEWAIGFHEVEKKMDEQLSRIEAEFTARLDAMGKAIEDQVAALQEAYAASLEQITALVEKALTARRKPVVKEHHYDDQGRPWQTVEREISSPEGGEQQ